MAYLITQIFFCLLIAFLLGLLTGWFFGRLGRKTEPQTLSNTPQQTITSPEKRSVAPTTNTTANFTSNQTPPPPPPIQKSRDGKTASEKLAAVPPPTKVVKKAEVEAQEKSPETTPPAKPKPSPKAAPAQKEAPKKKEPKAEKTKASKKAGTFDFSTLTALSDKGYEIETLEGVGPKTGEALRGIGIKTIADFLKEGHKPEQRAEIATKIAVRPKMVDGWAGMSDLLRIKGVDHQTAELMYKSGALTIEHLADLKAPEFVKKMEEVNTAGKRSIAPEVPGQSDISSWIGAAAKLDAIVEI